MTPGENGYLTRMARAIWSGSVSFGLVTIIMPTAPRPITVLRRASEAVAPTADLICVVSAASRETISPDCAVSKKPGESSVTWAKS